MKTYGSRTSTLVGLGSMVAVFLVLLLLLIVFSRQLLTHLPELNRPAELIAAITFVALPAILLALIVYQAVRLIRDRARRKPGALLKTRLMLFFATLVILATVPQGLLSVNFIDLANNFWLDAGIEESIDGATRLALDYYRQTNKNLERFSTSGLLANLLESTPRGAEEQWVAITEANPQIHFVQVFDDSGREILFFFSGDEGVEKEVRVSGVEDIRSAPEGIRKIDRVSSSFIRNHITRTVQRRTYYVSVGTVLSPWFADTSTKLSQAAMAFRQLDMFNRRINIVVVVVYFLFSLPIVLLSILVSFFLADEIILPIVSLDEATGRVAEGDFSFRILVRTNDELESLINSFNRMVTELADSRRKILHQEKITAWREIARRLAHEIKNPLTPIKLSAERILRKYVAIEGQSGATLEELGDVLRSGVGSIVREVESLDGLLREFGDFARLPVPTFACVNLRQAVAEAAEGYGGVRIRYTSIPADLQMDADPRQLHRVFSNLFQNAVHALGGGEGQIHVLADVVKRGDSDYCRIQVRDTGKGMDEDTRSRAFMPYFTSKKDGTGLGLAIVERIVFDHNGEIWVETQEGTGTTFFIDLPLSQG